METSPLNKTISMLTPAVAAGSTASFAIGKAPFAGAVTSIGLLPSGNATGNDTNKRTYTLVNKGQDGSGTTVMGTLDLVSSNNLVGFQRKAFVLSVVANALNVAKGDVLALVSTHAASGLADPGGTVEVAIARS